MRRSTFRPLSIAEIAERAAGGASCLTWPSANSSILADIIVRGTAGGAGGGAGCGRPGRGRLSRRLGRALASIDRLTRPHGRRGKPFPARAVFAGGLQSLKAILIVESPSAFRRRLIFISADALSGRVAASSRRTLELRTSLHLTPLEDSSAGLCAPVMRGSCFKLSRSVY